MASEGEELVKCRDYGIQTATPDDRAEIFAFIKKFFYPSEPLNEALNLGASEVPDHKIEDSPMDYLSDGLSLMALAPSGELIGVALNEVVKPKGGDTNASSSAPGAKISKLIRDVEDKITELSKSADNVKEMGIRVLTVHKNWRNKGFGKILLEESKDLAERKGFKRVRSVCTSAFTTKMFAGFGFESIYTLEYKDCVKKGIIDFLPQEPHTHINGVLLKF